MATFRKGHSARTLLLRDVELSKKLKLEPIGEYVDANRVINDNLYRDKIILQLISSDGHQCYICRKRERDPLNYEIDHIIPRSRGGADRLSNFGLTCQRCNRQKHDRYISVLISDRTPCYWIST